jgi:hypothetical protein
VNIEIKNNVLTLLRRAEDRAGAAARGFYRLQRTSGAFSRALPLPQGIEQKAVTPTLANGVLGGSLPEARAASRFGARVEPALIELVRADSEDRPRTPVCELTARAAPEQKSCLRRDGMRACRLTRDRRGDLVRAGPGEAEAGAAVAVAVDEVRDVTCVYG